MATEREDAFFKLLSKLHAADQTNKMLRDLKLISFRGSRSQILFIIDIIDSFSTLEKVVIVCDKYYCNEESAMPELLDLPALTKAKIIFV